MSTLGKVFAVLVLVLSVAYAAVTAVLYSTTDYWKGRHAAVEAEKKKIEQELTGKVNALESQVTMLKGNLETATDQANKLKDKNEALEDDIKKLKDSLAEKTTQLNTLQTNFDKIAGNIDTLMKEIEQKKALISSLEENAKELQAKKEELAKQRDDLTFRLQAATAANTDLTNKCKALMAEVEKMTDLLDRAKQEGFDVSKPSSGAGPTVVQKTIRGRVTGVRESAGLVVINVGSQDEVQSGYPFIVYRGAEFIAKIVVDKVYPEMSVANIEISKSPIQVGDTVTTKLAAF